MTIDNFIGHAVTELVNNGFSVYLHQEKMLEGCGGWFDADKKQFVCCMKNYMGIEIFVHEFSHFCQWRDRRKYFNNLNKYTSNFFEWLDGKKLDDDELELACKKSIELEYDCESNAIKLITQYDLPINLQDYIKAANSYLLFYNIVKEKRKWSSNKSVYAKSMLKYMPDTMQPLEFYQDPSNITKGMRTQYEKILQ